ncbi:MAG: hypothetical protein ABSB29_09955 [Nitrososphaerales archaeon]|jgi:hypothetical protein
MQEATIANELGHLKHHVQYPASRSQVVAACNNMSDVSEGNRDWFSKNLPEGTYKNATEIMGALLTKV